MNRFADIQISKKDNANVEVIYNPTEFTLLGRGRQGAVFKISDTQCVKIFARPNHAISESTVLLKASSLSFIPNIYEVGPNYIVMDYLSGPTLKQYLKKEKKISMDLAKQMVEILKEMKKKGFKNIDLPLRHVFLTEDGLKIVDHVYSYKREVNKPVQLFKELSSLKLLDSFMKLVSKIDQELVYEWNGTN